MLFNFYVLVELNIYLHKQCINNYLLNGNIYTVYTVYTQCVLHTHTKDVRERVLDDLMASQKI